MRTLIFWLVGLSTVLTLAAGVREERQAGKDRAFQKALAYLKEHRAQIGGLDPDSELRFDRVNASPNEFTVRFIQLYHGIPVEATGVFCSVRGDVVTLTRSDVRAISAALTPTINKQRAITIAMDRLRTDGAVREQDKSAELWVLPKNLPYAYDLPKDTLVWHVYISVDAEEGDGAPHMYVINAETGAVLDHQSLLRTNHGAAPRQTTDANARGPFYLQAAVLTPAFWAVHRSYACWTDVRRDPYTLQDLTYGVRGQTVVCDINGCRLPVAGHSIYNASGKTPRNLRRSPIMGTSQTAHDPFWAAPVPHFGNGRIDNSDATTAGADAYVSIQNVEAMLQLRFNHTGGVTGSDAPITVYVHRNRDWSPGSGSWSWLPLTSPTDFVMSLGDSGVDPLGAARTNATAPDFIAHEMGHGLNYTLYGNRGTGLGEALAIEEGNADIFAAIFDWHHTAGGHRNLIAQWIGEGTYAANWTAGGFTPTRALRYMDDPPRDAHPDPAAPARTIMSPACYSSSIASLDRHYGNGPYNHMFYLLANGGTSKCDATRSVVGIGYASAAAIWFEVVTNLQPTHQYTDLRQIWQTKAAQLFGSPSAEWTAVVDAFNAVHVP